MLAAATLVGLTWANSAYAVQNPGNNDFVSRWVGTRKFLMEGDSPYSENTTREIQELVYGRPANSDEDQALFVYPLFSVYLFAPFALISDYAIARAVWMTVLEVSLVALLMISLSLSRWKTPAWTTAILLIFTVFWVHSFRPVLDGNISILVALFVALSFMAVRAGNDGLAGFLLALAAVKPQVILLLAIFILLWSASTQRWRIFWGFISSLAFFSFTLMIFFPDWIWQFLRQLVTFYGYAAPGNPGGILKEALPGVGSQLGWAFTIVMATALIVEWRAALRKDFAWFYWAALLTLVASTLIGIPTSSSNFIVLYPALILVFSAWAQHWRTTGKWMIALSMLLLFLGLWWFWMSSLVPGEQTSQHAALFFPLPVFLFVSLYWVRWWVLRPAQPFLEQFRRLDRQGSRDQ